MLRRGMRVLGGALNEPNPFHIFKVNFLQIHHQNEDPRIVLARTKYANDIEKDVNALVIDAHRASSPHLTVLPIIDETGKIPEHRSIVAKDKYALAKLAEKDAAQQQYSTAFADCIQFYWDWSRARASEGVYPMDYNDTYDFGGAAATPAETEADLVKWLGYSLFIGLVGAVLTAQVWFIDYRGDGIMDWGMFYQDGKVPPAALKLLGLSKGDEEE